MPASLGTQQSNPSQRKHRVMVGRVIVVAAQVLAGSLQLLPSRGNRPLAKTMKLTQEKIWTQGNEKPPQIAGAFLGVTDKPLVTLKEYHLQDEKANEAGPDIRVVLAYRSTLISVSVVEKIDECYKV